jgi:O-antigen/teichoic acid export membrane protein
VNGAAELVKTVIPGESSGMAVQSLAGKTGWSALASFTSTASFALSSIIVAHVIGPSGTGEVAYSLWVVTAVAVVAGFGISQTITRFMAELDGAGRQDLLSGVGRWLMRRGALWLALGLLLLIVVEESRGASKPNRTLLAIIAVFYLCQGLGGLYAAALSGAQRFRRASSVNLWASVVQLAGVSTGVVVAGVKGAMAGYLIGALIPAVACVHFAVGPAIRPDATILRRCRQFSLHTWLAVTISLVLWSRTEVVFLDRYWDASEVGMFTIDLSLAQLATQGPLLMCSALIPHLAQLSGSGDRRRLEITFGSATRLIALMVFPLCFGAVAMAPVLVPFLFGARFAPAIPNTMVLVAVAAVGATATINSSLLYAIERAWFIALSGAVGAAVGLPLFVVGIHAYGSWGASCIRAALQVAIVIAQCVYSAKVVGIPVPWIGVGRIVVAALSGSMIGFVLCWLWPFPVMLILAIPAVAVGYLVSLRWTGGVAPEDIARFRNALRALPPLVTRSGDAVPEWISPSAMGSA